MKIILPVALIIQLSLAPFGLAQTKCKSTVVGDLRIEQFQSKIFDRLVTVRVWLPVWYTDALHVSTKYPVLYMLDGQNAFDQCTAFHGEQELQLDETVTRLIAEHKIPPIIVVGVDSAHGDERDYEYEAWKDPLTDGNAREPHGNELPLFFGVELIPYVSARYKVSDEAAHIGIGGTSGRIRSFIFRPQSPRFVRIGIGGKSRPLARQRPTLAGYDLTYARAGPGSNRSRYYRI